MRMAVGSDSECHLTDAITEYLQSKGLELVRCGALSGESADYVDAARGSRKRCHRAIASRGLFFAIPEPA